MNSVVSSFLDSGGGLVLSMVRFSPSIKSLHCKLLLVYNCEANDVCGVVHDECLCVYKGLLTNRLSGKAAELCLANS